MSHLRFLLQLGVALTVWSAQVIAFPAESRGPVRRPLNDADPEATHDLAKHNIGNVNGTLSNYGESANPNNVAGFAGFEFPLGSGNDCLFSGGIWVGAVLNGQQLVSTATDGDNGTTEFWPVHIGTIPQTNENEPDWFATSATLQEYDGNHFVFGGYAVDDDGDWVSSTDDLDSNGVPSENWDRGFGLIGFDDDGDDLIDEDPANGLDDDGDESIDEDSGNADANNDGNAGYDPEPRLNEDPPGDVSNDRLDNDHDGFTDGFDPDFDQDAAVGLLDDDNDGMYDEDAAGVSDQEYFCVYQDSIQPNFVGSPDIGGHRPLDIEVTQHSFAWSDGYLANVVIIEYTVRNTGTDALQNVHLAYFVDADILAQGESGDAGSLDDGCYFDNSRKMMVQYDDPEDDDGNGPCAFGVKAIRPPVAWANAQFSFRNFDRGSGGDPETNSDKYTMISSGTISPPSPDLGDWRMLMAWGSADGTLVLPPERTLNFAVALFAAEDTSELNQIADSLWLAGTVVPAGMPREVVHDFALLQNYPNPFNANTTISFDLPIASRVTLDVFDVRGRLVTTLIDSDLSPGQHRATFHADGLASGLYFYRMRAGKIEQIRKMVLLK